MQGNLLDVEHHRSMHRAVSEWRPPALPHIRGKYRRIIMDLETDGLEWWNGNKPVGFGIRAPESGESWYLPVGHRVGPNLDPALVKRWAQQELRDVEILNINTKFDVLTSRAWDVDLAAQGCTFADVAHFAALLDDHRFQFNQELLVKDFLGDDVGKTHAVSGFALDPARFADYPAGLVAPRALDDVYQVERLYDAMWPRIQAEGLERVAALESAIIPVVCEMEWNGTPIDVPRLEWMVAQSQRRIERICRKIYELTGLRFTPTNTGDWHKLLNVRGVEHAARTPKGAISLEDAHLKTIADPVIAMARHARNLSSLRSKFLVNYLERVQATGILRYDLHQLRSQPDEFSGGAFGTVSGRFSSANVNIQQVMTPEAQKAKRLADFVVRSLFVPGDGVWLSADAKQIEYRLFAHYAKNPTILAAYDRDPDTDYHDVVRDLLSFRGPRRQLKILNFSQLYGAGKAKFASMLGVDQDEADTLREKYFAMMPEARQLLDATSKLAMPGHSDKCRYGCSARHRGYVKTLLGRRARFGPNDRHYSALNRIIQGTAADANKLVLADVYRERKTLGLTMRNTVHDELNGSLASPDMLPAVQELLDRPRLDVRVSILWDAGIGANWGEAK
jgi:DNA polymerase I-like protein with 3'-5' exonuclease and polymerase domains